MHCIGTARSQPLSLSLSLSRPTEGQANKNPLDNNRVNSVTNKRRTGPRHGKRIHILRQYRTSTMKINETHLAAIRESAGRSSEVERSFMVRWVVGSILHGVDPLIYFSFQPVFHDWCNKGRGMWYPVCRMVHIKEPLLLIDKSSLCGGSGFPFSLSEWSLTICLTPYNRR